MENIQERALRFIYEDYRSNYEQQLLLIKSGLVSLRIRKIRCIALETFKIHHTFMALLNIKITVTILDTKTL